MRYWVAATLTLILLGATSAQVAKRRPVDKGPRALGLIELAANGKAHLVPITIMIDGRFYDASAYKADPIPMALQSEIVYEGLKTGVSQGLFAVAGAFHNPLGWMANGKWRSTADLEAEKAKSKADAEKRNQKAPPPEQEIGGPPKLRRGPEAPAQSAPPATSPSSSGPRASAPPTTSKPGSSSTEHQTSAPPSIVSDAGVYGPGATVTLSGAGWLPAEHVLRLARVADEEVDFRRPFESWVQDDVFLPVQADTAERHLDQLAH